MSAPRLYADKEVSIYRNLKLWQATVQQQLRRQGMIKVLSKSSFRDSNSTERSIY